LEGESVSPCMIWPGSIGKHGYGIATHDGEIIRAHRLAYLKAHGELPKGLVIMHLCNVKSCVNPDHLKAGTQSENIADAGKLGLMSRYGNAAGRAKLTWEQVGDIRTRSASGESALSLSKAFGVTRANIYMIVKKKTRVYA
jgi:hypothetical protein